MKSSQVLFLVGGAAGFLAAGYVVLSLGGESVTDIQPASIPTPTIAAGSIQQTDIDSNGKAFAMRALRREVSLLRDELKSVKSQVQQLAVAASGLSAKIQEETIEESVSQAVEAFPEPATEEALLRQDEQMLEQRMTFIESSFFSEPVDGAWSVEAIDTIDEATASEELAETAVFAVDCRATLCRMEVQHDDPQALAEFEQWLPRKVVDMLPRITMDRIDGIDGSVTTVVYLARDGYRLPGLAEAD